MRACTTRPLSEGCYLERCTDRNSVIGIRTHVLEGTTITRSVLLGADYYEADDVAPARGDCPRLGIGRNVVLDRVIVDKNARIGDGARLVNEKGLDACRRRRLLHPQRRHHRAEGRRHQAGDGDLISAWAQALETGTRFAVALGDLAIALRN